MSISPNIDPPNLNLNPPRILEMKERLKILRYQCNFSFCGNKDWRAKASMEKQTKALENQIGQEQEKIQQDYYKALADYNQYLQELKEAEERAKYTTAIRELSLSELISENNDNNDNKDTNVNPITDLSL